MNRHPPGGRPFRFADPGLCEGFRTCARHRADRLFFGRFLGIPMLRGEDLESYLVIDLVRGSPPFDTGVRPVAAPLQPPAAVADNGEINPPIIGGLAVVDLLRRRVLWHQPEWDREARIEAWEGAACARASDRPGMLGEDTPVRTVWIAQTGGHWGAHDARRAVCARP